MAKLSMLLLFCIFMATGGLAQAEDFEWQVYASSDGRETVALESVTRVRRTLDGTTTAGTYVREKDTLRVTLPVQGVSFTSDYRVTKEGLISKHGKVLLHKELKERLVTLDQSGTSKRHFPAPPYPKEIKDAKELQLIKDTFHGSEEDNAVLAITFSDKGDVTNVKVLESTGSTELDNYTTDWVKKRWRYPTGKAITLRVPFKFTLGKSGEPSQSQSRNRSTPWPPYPQHLQERSLEGTLTLGMAVNANGEVVSTKVLRSTGHPELDSYTADWVKSRWKLPPGEPRMLQQLFRFEAKDSRSETSNKLPATR